VEDNPKSCGELVIYTDDSYAYAAAVHDGVIDAGKPSLPER